LHTGKFLAKVLRSVTDNDPTPEARRQRAMTTEQATARLAKIYRTGDADSKEERSAERHLWEGAERAAALDWVQADQCLEAAYRAFGAEPPLAPAHDFECGRHPIQLEAERQYQEQMGDTGAPIRRTPVVETGVATSAAARR
jgi:hypothetical protein